VGSGLPGDPSQETTIHGPDESDDTDSDDGELPLTVTDDADTPRDDDRLDLLLMLDEEIDDELTELLEALDTELLDLELKLDDDLLLAELDETELWLDVDQSISARSTSIPTLPPDK